MFNYLNKRTYTHEYWKGHGTSILQIQVSTWELLLPRIWPFAIPTPLIKKKKLSRRMVQNWHKASHSEDDLGI